MGSSDWYRLISTFKWNKDDSLALKVISEIFINALQRKTAENALMQSELNYREIFNSTNEGIVIYNTTENRVTDANNAFLAMYGLTYEEVLKVSFAASDFHVLRSFGETGTGNHTKNYRARFSRD